MATTAVAGLLTAIFSLCQSAHKKGARLDPLSLQVLLYLRAIKERCEVEELTNHLGELPVDEGASPWTGSTWRRCSARDDGRAVAIATAYTCRPSIDTRRRCGVVAVSTGEWFAEAPRRNGLPPLSR